MELRKCLNSNILVVEEDFIMYKNELEGLHYKFYTMEKEKSNKLHEFYDNKEREKNYYLNLWTHQIKTPISAINLMAQGKTENREADLKLELKKIILYVDNIINYMKLEDNALDFLFKKQSLEKIINSSVKNNSLLFIYKGIDLKLDISDIEIVTDEKWLIFALDQIIVNSLKYTDEGNVCIFNNGDNPYVLHIVDSGVGIAAEDLPRVAELGYTGKMGRVDPNSTGIGLYITDKILRELDYSYEIKSQEGKGTEFVINLKREKLYQD